MTQMAIDFSARVATARQLGEAAGECARVKADDACPGFTERALAFIRTYAASGRQFRGEDCTNAAKLAGIVPHDDRAFGPIYARALRDGVIQVIGYVPRVKGHGSAGGKLYAGVIR